MGRDIMGLQLGTLVASGLKRIFHLVGRACFFRGHFGLKVLGTADWWAVGVVLRLLGLYVQRTCADVDPDGTGERGRGAPIYGRHGH